MTLGIECIKFMLEQDPANVPIVQRWMDKWFWRGYRLLTLVAMMQDYMLPKRVMSWKEAWEMYAESNGGALFADLARFGIRKPAGWDDACEGKDHISHQAWATFYQYGHAAAFHTWLPGEDEMGWLAQKYPDTFDTYYRGRFDHWRSLAKEPEKHKEGGRWFNQVLPMLCQTCQVPMLFTEPGDPTQIAFRESSYHGMKYHFCSDHCKTIFDEEPSKYSQAWLPVHQIYQGSCYPEDINPASPGDSPVREVLRYYGVDGGRDNGDFEASVDRRNFAAWSGRVKGAKPAEGEGA
jgi:phenol hydroxylase P3 protein